MQIKNRAIFKGGKILKYRLPAKINYENKISEFLAIITDKNIRF